MNGFEYYTPTRVVFGEDTEKRVGELAKAAGAHKALVHFGGKSAMASGLLDRVTASLDQAGVAHVELGGVVPNPRLSKVRAGIELGKREGVDFVLAVGGGSVIDSAKAIAYGMGEPDEDVWGLFSGKRRARTSLPVGVVLTNAASGSEMSDSCVISDEETGEKRGYNDDKCRPRFAVLDPKLTLTLSDWQTAAGCTDILMHTMERYFTGKGNMEVTDQIAEGLMRTVLKYAEVLHRDPSDLNARAEVMWAGSLSHNGLTGCGNGGNDFMSHKMEHELSGMFDVTHGAGLAVIWPAWARYVHKDCLDRFVRFAENVMGVDPGVDDEATAMAGIEAFEAFLKRIGMPTSLDELGVRPTEEQIDRMADSCAKAMGGHGGSAKVLGRDDFVRIYKAAALA